MMRFTQLLAAAAKRASTGSKVGKSVLLAAALNPKRKVLPHFPVTKLVKPSGSGKHVPSSFLLKGKKKVVTAKAGVMPKKQKVAKVLVGPSNTTRPSALYMRFYNVLKKIGCVKGKRRMKKAGELWRATKRLKDFDKRVEAAIRLSKKKGKSSKGRKLLKKAAAKKKGTKPKKSTTSKKGVKKASRRVSKKKTLASTVPPLP
ncbi:hypothetical protein TRSC58_04866 [Trypanosoma rangeli SC58]|uniref:Uncharacterized protein n=1 Tax=Trypanosoma rangeli SC58 TaxID=429131 RepID=A0A061IXP7_TRYRA|nr:hypothetical protein TRSC58_04866 [Trypanosoma rangeli SC58]